MLRTVTTYHFDEGGAAISQMHCASRPCTPIPRGLDATKPRFVVAVQAQAWAHALMQLLSSHHRSQPRRNCVGIQGIYCILPWNVAGRVVVSRSLHLFS